MRISLVKGLPFIAVALSFQNKAITLDHVLLDTGSAGTIFPVDRVVTIDLYPDPQDKLHRIRGVGGAEFVFKKQVDWISLGNRKIEKFGVELGAMDYGFDIDGIAGTDLLVKTKAIINMEKLEITFDT